MEKELETKMMFNEPTGIPLIQQSIKHHDRTAIIDANGEYSFEQLLSQAKIVATNLLRGDLDLKEAPVAFMVPSGFNYVAVLWGIWLAGGIAVPLCSAHPKREMEYVIESSEAKILVVHADFEVILRSLERERNLHYFTLMSVLRGEQGPLPEISTDRRAMIIYTSGTTSRPKGVVTTHGILTCQITSLITAWEWSSDDYIVHTLPLHHVHGIINVLCCALWAGAVCEMLPQFEPEKVWNSFLDGRSTLFMAVPTIYVRMIQYWEGSTPALQRQMSAACENLRLTISGSAALPVSIFNRWREISGHDFLERYGMTEIGMALSNPYNGERKPGYVGKPLPGVAVRLVDSSGNEITEENIPGEIQVKSSSVFLEYWRKAEATKKAFKQGWFCTGDVAIREKGCYRILGRSSVDIIKSGGYKISALEIEEVLRTHPAIQECSVVGIENEEWGERVAAVLQLKRRRQLTLEDLRSWGKQQMAAYKVPQIIKLVEVIPRNVMGKVSKPELKKLFNN